jgi:hypothetical protein
VKFTKQTEFIDCEGMPISNHIKSDSDGEDEFIKSICYCWDTLPPRWFDLSSALRNGSPCNEEHFRSLVKNCLLNKKTNQTKQMLLYAHWFDETSDKAATLAWLKGLTDDEITILVGATFPQFSKQEEVLDSAEWQDFQNNMIQAFRENTTQIEIKNCSFLSFLEDYEKQVLALI